MSGRTQDKKLSIRDLVAEANDIEKRLVDVPEWGVEIELRAFSLDARSGFLDQMQVGNLDGDEEVKGAMKRMYPAMLIAACHDPDTGAPVFDETDVSMLLTKNGNVVDRLGDQIMKMNGMVEGAVDDAKKDSSTTPSSSTS